MYLFYLVFRLYLNIFHLKIYVIQKKENVTLAKLCHNCNYYISYNLYTIVILNN